MADYFPDDVVYLQVDDDWMDASANEIGGVTWCPDQQHSTDIEYLLATPKRKAADAMYEVVKVLDDWANGEPGQHNSMTRCLMLAEAALDLADGD